MARRSDAIPPNRPTDRSIKISQASDASSSRLVKTRKTGRYDESLNLNRFFPLSRGKGFATLSAIDLSSISIIERTIRLLVCRATPRKRVRRRAFYFRYMHVWIRRKRTSKKKLSRKKEYRYHHSVIVNNYCSLNNINIKWRQKCNNKSSFVGKYMATKKLRLQICFAFEALSGSCSCVTLFFFFSFIFFTCSLFFLSRIHTRYTRIPTLSPTFTRSSLVSRPFLSDIKSLTFTRSLSLSLSCSLFLSLSFSLSLSFCLCTRKGTHTHTHTLSLPPHTIQQRCLY